VITKQDLQQAINECQGVRNPNANTCIKLAAFLTIQRELFGESEQFPVSSYSNAPVSEQIFTDRSSEFLRMIDGRNQTEVIPVIDELMSTIEIIQPRLYDAVLNKLNMI
jgi:hypothetical protein